eukprot:4184790-Prymnesium_polylepis.1
MQSKEVDDHRSSSAASRPQNRKMRSAPRLENTRSARLRRSPAGVVLGGCRRRVPLRKNSTISSRKRTPHCRPA